MKKYQFSMLYLSILICSCTDKSVTPEIQNPPDSKVPNTTIIPPALEKPVIQPASGEYDPQWITTLITSTIGGGEIHYTINGDNPTKRSPAYNSAIIVAVTGATSIAVKARVWWGNDSSSVTTATYSISTIPWNSVVKTENLYDSRDGKSYKAVLINNRTWMAENLNYELKGDNSVCYRDSVSYCSRYGRLYTWAGATGISSPYSYKDTISRIKGICPEGWHLPSDSEWNEMNDYIKSTIYTAHPTYDQSQLQMTIRAKNGWAISSSSPRNLGTDEFGLRLLPGGYCAISTTYMTRTFSGEGNTSYFWTSSNSSAGGKFQFPMLDPIGYLNRSLPYENMLSIRCVKNY